MEGRKLLVLIISILMILIVPIIIYGFNFNSVAFDENVYKKEFLKHNVYKNLESYDIESINSEVLHYLSDGKNNNLIENNFFNEREKLHLSDVKNLIQKILTIYYVSMILFLLLMFLLIYLLKFNLKAIAKKIFIIVLVGGALTLLDAVLLFILSNVNFDFVFEMFHKTFFIPETYTFNPQLENIVVIYPGNLFFDFLVKIVINAAISSIILLFFCIMPLFFLKQAFFRKFT
ncbi:MAG: DUF1461 domain-containing protein [Candidatus Woesearchaeota archaeon]